MTTTHPQLRTQTAGFGPPFRVMATALLLCALPLFAQQYGDSITVNVVDVPVYVERFGKPVTGLTRDDFELFANGERQEIEYFDVLETKKEAAPGPAAAPAPARLDRRRLIVLLFDVGGSSARSLHRARMEAVQFVERNPDDTFAVAMIARSGVQFLVPFTSDRVAIQRAIGTFAPSGADDPFRVATLEAERSFWRDAVGGSELGLGGVDTIWGGAPWGGFSSSRAAAVAKDFYQTIARVEEEERLAGDRRFIQHLGELADRMASLDGVKHVVLLSERTTIPDLVRLSNPSARAHARYRAAGVILDGVDIRQPWAPGGSASSAAAPSARPNLFPSDLLYSLALDTGGTVTSSLQQLEERNRITYVLGFKPSRTKPGSNSISVRVKNARVLTDVRHRRSFTLDAGQRGDDALFLADTLLNDIPQHGVTIDLHVQGTWVEARVPGAELLAHPADAPLPLGVFFYVFDASGEAVAWSEVRVRVDLAAGKRFLETNPYAIRQQFKLEPGRHTAKVVVRIEDTDLIGFRRKDFDVP